MLPNLNQAPALPRGAPLHAVNLLLPSLIGCTTAEGEEPNKQVQPNIHRENDNTTNQHTACLLSNGLSADFDRDRHGAKAAGGVEVFLYGSLSLYRPVCRDMQLVL
jgi:hypothetical protein